MCASVVLVCLLRMLASCTPETIQPFDAEVQHVCQYGVHVLSSYVSVLAPEHAAPDLWRHTKCASVACMCLLLVSRYTPQSTQPFDSRSYSMVTSELLKCLLFMSQYTPQSTQPLASAPTICVRSR